MEVAFDDVFVSESRSGDDDCCNDNDDNDDDVLSVTFDSSEGLTC